MTQRFCRSSDSQTILFSISRNLFWDFLALIFLYVLLQIKKSCSFRKVSISQFREIKNENFVEISEISWPFYAVIFVEFMWMQEAFLGLFPLVPVYNLAYYTGCLYFYNIFLVLTAHSIVNAWKGEPSHAAFFQKLSNNLTSLQQKTY